MRTFVAPLLCTTLVLTPAQARAQATPDITDRGARPRSGGLHRAAAAVDATVELYRLSLVELTRTAERLIEEAHAGSAQSAAAIPAAIHEVFVRLAEALATRVARDALPPIARGYHVEVLQAMTALAEATTLAEVAAPWGALTRALEHVAAEGDDLVDLFSRQRPLEVHIVDGESIVTEIADALDEVARAESRIQRARQERRSTGEQLEAFMLLEISLGHALDLIAAAEEAGVHIGFELQLSTAELGVRLNRVHELLAELQPLSVEIMKAPAAAPSHLRAVLQASGSAAPPTVRLSWAELAPGASVTMLRLYRVTNIAAVRTALERSLRCEGRSAIEAAERAREEVSVLDDAPTLVATLEPGRVSYTDELPSTPLAPPLYRLIAVTAFGVESPPVTSAAGTWPAFLAGVELVEASPVDPPVESALFYRDLDAVKVRWSPSPSDLRHTPEMAALAAMAGAPLVGGYRLLRRVDTETTEVTTLAPGTTEYVDHPEPRDLARGVAYGIVSQGAAAADVAPSPWCVSASVRSPAVIERLTLARAGFAQIERPSQTERRWARELENPESLAHVKREFAKRPEDTREALRGAWWLAQPQVERERWLARWDQHALGTLPPPGRLAQLHLALAQAQSWIDAHGQDVRPEIDRWWQLLTERRRNEAAQRWLGSLSPEAQTWLREELASSDTERQRRAQKQTRLLAWWLDRDPLDRRIVLGWWDGLSVGERQTLLAAWIRELPAPLRTSVRYPRVTQLESDERASWLAEGYRDLPSKLEPRFFSWLRWHELAPQAKLVAIASEAGVLGRSLAAVRYRLRPLDRATGFRLPLLGFGSVGFLAIALVLWRTIRRDRS